MSFIITLKIFKEETALKLFKMCVVVVCVCVCVRMSGPLRLELQAVVSPTCGSWKPNLDPLLEQYVL